MINKVINKEKQKALSKSEIGYVISTEELKKYLKDSSMGILKDFK